MAEIRYAGVNQVAGYYGKLVEGSCWTLKDWYSQLQSQPFNSRIADLL